MRSAPNIEGGAARSLVTPCSFTGSNLRGSQTLVRMNCHLDLPPGSTLVQALPLTRFPSPDTLAPTGSCPLSSYPAITLRFHALMSSSRLISACLSQSSRWPFKCGWLSRPRLAQKRLWQTIVFILGNCPRPVTPCLLPTCCCCCCLSQHLNSSSPGPG